MAVVRHETDSVKVLAKNERYHKNDGRTNFEKNELRNGILKVKQIWLHIIYGDRSEHKVFFGIPRAKQIDLAH